MTSAPAIGFEYAPSRLLAKACAALTLLALSAVGLSGLPWPGRVGLACALALAALLEWRTLRRTSIRAAGWAADGSWMLRDASSTDLPATLLSARVLGGCLWLRLQPAAGRPLNLLLAPDNSDADLRRRLRMRLAAAPPAS